MFHLYPLFNYALNVYFLTFKFCRSCMSFFFFFFWSCMFYIWGLGREFSSVTKIWYIYLDLNHTWLRSLKQDCLTEKWKSLLMTTSPLNRLKNKRIIHRKMILSSFEIQKYLLNHLFMLFIFTYIYYCYTIILKFLLNYLKWWCHITEKLRGKWKGYTEFCGPHSTAMIILLFSFHACFYTYNL